MDELNRLAFAYRWSTRAIMLDKTDATRLLTKIRRQWFAKRKSIAAILKEVMTNEASALLDASLVITSFRIAAIELRLANHPSRIWSATLVPHRSCRA